MRWHVFGMSVLSILVILIIGYWLGRKNPSILSSTVGRVTG